MQLPWDNPHLIAASDTELQLAIKSRNSLHLSFVSKKILVVAEISAIDWTLGLVII